MKKLFALPLICAPLLGCVEAQPIVSDYNGDSVKIVTSQFDSLEYQRASAQKEADRICAVGGKKAEYASTLHDNQNYQSHNLYLCL